jgi:alpha-ribazole phosphatase
LSRLHGRLYRRSRFKKETALTRSIITRWHFVRHAPVLGATGHLYASADEPADVSNTRAFAGLASFLPQDALWITSPLQRALQTADAMAAAGLRAAERLVDARLSEQHYGDWYGADSAALARMLDGKPFHKMWMTTAEDHPPGGESYLDVMARVRAALDDLTAAHGPRPIIVVAHGGSIRAALAHALGLDGNKALTISVDNLSTTRIDHVPGPGIGGDWRVVYVNRRPQA